MNPELTFLLRSLSRCVYYVTDEEDRFLLELKEVIKSHVDQTMVFCHPFGLVSLNNLTKDWTSKGHPEPTSNGDLQTALTTIYKQDTRDKQHFYVFTDPERYLTDPNIVRRFVNLIHQLKQDNQTIKIIIFVGSRKVIPEKLARYVEVVHDTGPSHDVINQTVEDAAKAINLAVPPDAVSMFKGLTTYEITRTISQSLVKTKRDPGGLRIDPKIVGEFRRNQIRKTDLVQYVDTDDYPFSVVGGAERFKEWSVQTQGAWTEEGRKFGLKPPKGVLCVGVWGCGKSLSVKALGNAWNLPMIQLEMGRLRSSGVGESEANVYKALRIIEAVSPCLVWVDEAEKSLSGGASSNQSDAGTTSRTIGILSTWMQETKADVCLCMTSNNLDTLPVEFINRMDERFFFDVPTEENRVDILKIHIRKNGQNPENFDLATLAELAKDLVGREIEFAVVAAMRISFSARKAGLDETILAEELRGRPRILRTMSDDVQKIVNWVGFDPDYNDGIRARYASAPANKGAPKGSLKVG